MAVWEAGKVQLQAGLCRHCVVGELLQAQTSLVQWVRHLWNKQVCTWAQCWDGLQWLMAEVKTVFRKGPVESTEEWLSFPWVSEPPLFLLPSAEVCPLNAGFPCDFLGPVTPHLCLELTILSKATGLWQEEPIGGALVWKKPEREVDPLTVNLLTENKQTNLFYGCYCFSCFMPKKMFPFKWIETVRCVLA